MNRCRLASVFLLAMAFLGEPSTSTLRAGDPVKPASSLAGRRPRWVSRPVRALGSSRPKPPRWRFPARKTHGSGSEP